LAFTSLLAADEAVGPFQITSHDPPQHEVGVPLNANLHATFDDDVNAGSLTNDTFVVHGHLGGLASGTFTYEGGTRTVTLDPDRGFHAGEVLRVSAISGISSTGAAALTPYGWQFTAGDVYRRDGISFHDIGADLSGVNRGAVAWADYDNDGDLDILLTGSFVSKVYRNNGSAATPAFTDTEAGLGPVATASAACGDYDNDGDLDILLNGDDESWIPVSKVYRNDGAFSFTDIGAGLMGLNAGSVAWADYDNDGDLDILLTGFETEIDWGPHTLLYRNDGTSGFTDIGAGLWDVQRGSVAWGDYDNDGDLDILLTGASPGPGHVSRVYRNDGGEFTDIGAGLPGLAISSAAWGDYDNDGDLDILLTGQTRAKDPVSRVYRNDGASGFTDIGAGLVAIQRGSVAWGDYDNDGDLDILLTGKAGSGCVSKVYRNDGVLGFADIGADLTNVCRSSVAWGDYDNDGDLDILLAGQSDAGGSVSKVYRNNSAPQLGAVTPSTGSGPAGVTRYFNTTWSDPDGWEDMKHCYFHIGASSSLAGNVTLMYDVQDNKLWMRSDDGTMWLGGYAPWSDNTIENRQAKVYCALTRDEGSGDTLSVRWAIKFKADFRGAKKTGLKCTDVYNARAKGAWVGTWNIY
jgi:hypothetical protein